MDELRARIAAKKAERLDATLGEYLDAAQEALTVPASSKTEER